MSTRSQRRLGLTRQSTLHPLHPNAYDSTASKTKGRDGGKEKDVFDLPDGSSDESSEEVDAGVEHPGSDDDDDFLPGPSSKRRKLAHTKPLGPAPSIVQKAETSQEDEGDPFATFDSSQKSKRAGNRYYGKKRGKSAREHNNANAKNNNAVSVDAVALEQGNSGGFKAPPKYQFAGASKPKDASPGGFKVPSTLKSSGKNVKSRSEFKKPPAPAVHLVQALGLTDNEQVRQLRHHYAPATSVTQSTSAASTLSTPLSSPLSEYAGSPLQGSEVYPVDDKADAISSTTSRPCPICGEDLPVEGYDRLVEEVLPALSINSRRKSTDSAPQLNIRQQAQFCRRHREESAREEWKKRGYPQIEWADLPTRIRDMEPEITKLIDSGAQRSVFLQKVSQNNQGNKARPTRSSRRAAAPRDNGRRHKVAAEHDGSMGAEDVGYYGGRGSRCIGEVLVEEFAGRFRNAQGKAYQAIASAGGVARFVQRVLVPEVIVRLIMQDMGCKVGKAREVLVQSADLGKLVCEEENDEVEDDEVENDELEDQMTDDET